MHAIIKWVAGLAVFCASLLNIAFADSPLTLEQAVAAALADNPEARIAELKINAARAQLRQSEAAFWPQVQLGSTYSRTNNPVQAFGMTLNQRAFNLNTDFNHPDDTDDLNTRASVNLALFNGGRNFAGREAAAAGTEAAKHGAEAVRSALAFEVANAFYTVVKAQKFIEAAQSNVRALESSYLTASKRVKEGAALKTDLLDVGVQLAKAKEDYSRSVNAEDLAIRALANLLGGEAKEVVVDPQLKEPVIPGEMSIDNHPAILAAKAQVSAAEAMVRRAKGGYLPQLSAFANYDHDQGWETNESGDSWTGGIIAQVNAWDGLLTKGRVDEADAQLQQAREESRKLRLGLGLQVEQARLNLRDAQERLSVTEQSVTQAKESAELTRNRYEQGLASSTQLIDAENALTAAKVRRAEAEADRRIAVAALRKALGLSQV